MARRVSKIKNIYGESQKAYFDDLKTMEIATDGQLFDANTDFVAISWQSSGGGNVAVLKSEYPAPVPNNTPLIKGHSGPVFDIKFSPFKPNILATASEDSHVKIWNIPPEGLVEDLYQEVQVLKGHSKKVGVINWHPTVFEILASGSMDNKVNVWNVCTQDSIYNYNFNDTLMSLEWNTQGSLLGLTSKDKTAHILDPRVKKCETTFKTHDSIKNSRLKWLNNEILFTVGYSKNNHRELKLWDLRNLEKELQLITIDSLSGPIMPHYDEDTHMIYLPGRGEAFIKYYEYFGGQITYVGDYKSETSQKSTCLFPKRAVNYQKSEITRIGKLTNTTLEYISFQVPKKVEGFHTELYPLCRTADPALTFDEWEKGVLRDPIRKEIEYIEKKWVAETLLFERYEEEIIVSDDPEVLRKQLDDLMKLYENNEITIQVLQKEIERETVENEKLKSG